MLLDGKWSIPRCGNAQPAQPLRKVWRRCSRGCQGAGSARAAVVEPKRAATSPLVHAQRPAYTPRIRGQRRRRAHSGSWSVARRSARCGLEVQGRVGGSESGRGALCGAALRSAASREPQHHRPGPNPASGRERRRARRPKGPPAARAARNSGRRLVAAAHERRRAVERAPRARHGLGPSAPLTEHPGGRSARPGSGFCASAARAAAAN